MRNKRGISLIYVIFFSFFFFSIISTIVIYSSNKKYVYLEIKKDRFKDEKNKKYILRKEKKKDIIYFNQDKNGNNILFSNKVSVGGYKIDKIISFYDKSEYLLPKNEKEIKGSILLELIKNINGYEIIKKEKISIKNNKMFIEDLGLNIYAKK